MCTKSICIYSKHRGEHLDTIARLLKRLGQRTEFSRVERRFRFWWCPNASGSAAMRWGIFETCERLLQGI